MTIVLSPYVPSRLWSYWFPDLLPHVPGCPAIVAEHELRRAAQAFFGATRAWKVDLAPVAVTAGSQDVTVTLPSDQELVRVENAWYDGSQLTLTTAEDLDRDYGTDWNTHTGTPLAYLQLTPGAVTLYPVPLVNATTGLKMRVAVRPSENSTGLPDEMAVKFRDEIIVGAKSKLMMYPNKPWSNPDLGMLAAQTFDALMGKAHASAARAFGAARKPARPKWC